VILTKNKNNNSPRIRALAESYFLDGTRHDLSKIKNPENPYKIRLFGTFLE